ncbi:lysostaphin resistance A-like protein [Roseivirga sp. BDSF3-8]|uniref:CPBP family intramembrane glutamic endopeptidase n=1 Tax=Roseivirga sp. BDSF3-8 TaxID=3241598 RepID=UPI0035320FCB
MIKMDSLAPLSMHRPPWLSLIVAILFFVGGIIFIGPMLGILALLPLSGLDVNTMNEMLTNPSAFPEAKTGILLFQGINSFGAFIIAPLLYLLVTDKVHPGYFFNTRNAKPGALLLCAAITFFYMQVNGVFIEWNAGLTLPEGLAPVEAWMKNAEDTAMRMTEFLTDFSSPGYFLLTVLVLAILPAIGEELLFRGIFQNLIARWFGNIHVGIWASAFLFSAVHMQFYGFVPRLLLGALFGYLYIWSGNMVYAMLAHFINNFLSLLALYLVQQGVIDVDFSATETLPTGSLLIAAVLAIAGTVFFKRLFGEHNDKESWETVYRSPEEYRAQMVTDILEKKGLNPVLLNKKESAYGTTGDYEVSVIRNEADGAHQIIKNDIEF